MTWWDSLSLGGQLAVWLVGTLIGLAVLFLMGHAGAKFLNRITLSTEYEPYKNPWKSLMLFGLAISVVSLLSIIGLPSTFVMPIGGMVVASALVVIGPWLRDSSFMDNAKIYRATLGWRKGIDWVTSSDGTVEGYWNGANMSFATIHGPDGKVHHIPLRVFLSTMWVNANRRTQENRLGLMRVDVPFPFFPNDDIPKATEVILQVASGTPDIIEDMDAGVRIETYDTIDADCHRVVLRYWVANHDAEVSTRAFLYREGSKQLAENGILLYDKSRVHWVQTPKHDAKAQAVHVSTPKVTHDTIQGIVQRQQPPPVEVQVPVEQPTQAAQPVAAQPAPVQNGAPPMAVDANGVPVPQQTQQPGLMDRINPFSGQQQQPTQTDALPVQETQPQAVQPDATGMTPEEIAAGCRVENGFVMSHDGRGLRRVGVNPA